MCYFLPYPLSSTPNEQEKTSRATARCAFIRIKIEIGDTPPSHVAEMPGPEAVPSTEVVVPEVKNGSRALPSKDLNEGNLDITIQSEDSAAAGGHHVTGWTDVLTVHINEYIRYYRMVPWVLGSVGVVVFLRYSRTPIARFRQVSDIPHDFVLENRKMSGVVKATGWNTVGVWHVPAWRWLLRWRTHPPGKLI